MVAARRPVSQIRRGLSQDYIGGPRQVGYRASACWTNAARRCRVVARTGRIAVALPLALPMISLAETTTAPRPFMLGADISALASLERQGVTFRDDGQPQYTLRIFT